MMKKVRRIGVLALALMLTITNTVVAKESEPVVKVNDVIQGSTGSKEVVIRVNEDGSYVSCVYSLQKASVKANSTCDHTNLVEYSKYTETESYKKKNATYCYKTRIVQNARCAKCGKTGIKMYGKWTKYKHKYSLFGKTCKKCGYKK